MSEYEIWKSDKSGVLTETPLIMTACKGGQIGSVFSYDGGSIYKTVFTYLCGAPDENIINEHPEFIYENRLVCMSAEWEEYIKTLPIKFKLRREVMAPFCSESSKELRPLPEGYTLTAFTPEIFDSHPFDHGRNYKDYQDFADRGAGAAVLFEDHAHLSVVVLRHELHDRVHRPDVRVRHGTRRREPDAVYLSFRFRRALRQVHPILFLAVVVGGPDHVRVIHMLTSFRM